MTDVATTPGARRTRIVRAVEAYRREGGEPVEVRAGGVCLRYEDRELTLHVSEAQRDRLDALMASYPVFKLAQPATRKAPEGTVVVAAIADPKHLADFCEDCFREVYGLEADYALAVNP